MSDLPISSDPLAILLNEIRALRAELYAVRALLERRSRTEVEPSAISIAETANRLSVSAKTVRGLLDNGALRRVRCGRRVLVEVRSIEQFVGQNSATTRNSDEALLARPNPPDQGSTK